MLLRILVAVALVIAGVTAQAPGPQPVAANASVSGVVRNALTGAPLAGISVSITGATGTTTDSQGRFTLSNVPPGRRALTAIDPGRGVGSGMKLITVFAGSDVTSLELTLTPAAGISGKVFNEDGDPLPGVDVIPLLREYSLGSLRYKAGASAQTNDKGEYALRTVLTGRGYILMARPRIEKLDALSESPADPALRKKVLAPTFFPASAAVDGALPIVLATGEQRESADIRVLRAPSYCIEGVAAAGGSPASLYVRVAEPQPSMGGETSLSLLAPPAGKSGPDGKFRICGLHPGNYALEAYQLEGNPARAISFGRTPVAIGDHDLRDVAVTAQSAVTLRGEVVWGDPTPDKPVESKLRILLTPVLRALFDREYSVRVHDILIPSQFESAGVLADDFQVQLTFLPDGTYIKDVTYAGSSVLHAPLRLGGASGGGEPRLHVVLGRDGGSVRARAADRDGKPVQKANVYLMPAGVASEAELAETVVSGGTDSDGVWTSKLLAPGKYTVLTSTADIDRSPEGIAKLWSARSRAKAIEIGPKATAEVTLEIQALDR